MDDRLINLLLVDDDQVDVMNVERAFKKNNLSNPLYIASNGLEALTMLRGEGATPEVPGPRRLILLDLNMPKMGGIEFLRELRADKDLRAIPVIVLTTSDEDSDKVEAYNLNVAGYILKPVTLSKFVEAIATLNQYWTLNEMP
jgi:CheY-like chemotaxis protein